MSSLSFPEFIGFAGVALLLIAFFLNLFKLLRADHFAYLALNMIGAGLACLSSYLIAFMPFVLLEGTWALVAAVALARNITRGGSNRARETTKAPR
jgi:hypothetical protein